jgi:quercetin dioxygenase-like cupin family protein
LALTLPVGAVVEARGSRKYPCHITVRKPLLTAVADPAKTLCRIEVKEIEFKPGQATGVHQHPCPVTGYIAEGSVIFQVEGEAAKTLKAGDAFFEPANTRIVHFDNASATQPMAFIAFYLLGEDERELIRMLE